MNLLEVKKIRTKCSGIIEALWRWWQIEWISKYKGAFGVVVALCILQLKFKDNDISSSSSFSSWWQHFLDA
jgi:hypothetical protein